jgi:hypothetical protein
MKAYPLLMLLVLLAVAGSAAAQVPGAVQQVDQSEQRRRAEASARAAVSGDTAPELYAGESADLGPQQVIGVARRRQLIEASADAQYYYTDNFFLTEEPFTESTTVLLSTVDVALAPTPYPLGDGWFAPRIGFRHQWYNFGLETDQPFDVFDFRAQTLYGEGRFRLAEHWTVEAGVDAQRLLHHDTGDEFYRELAPRWGLTWRRPVCRAVVFEAGYRGLYRITQTDGAFPDDLNDRLDTFAYASLAITCGERFVAQPYYRYQYTRYDENPPGLNRDGQIHSLGLGCYYFLSEWCSVRGFIHYDNAEFRGSLLPDYRNFNAGGGVNLTLRF